MITSNFLKKLNSSNPQPKSSSFHLNNFFKYVNPPTTDDSSINEQTSNNIDTHINPPNIQPNKFNDNLKNIIDSITKYSDQSSIDEAIKLDISNENINEIEEENMWNKEMVKEFIDISEECSEESIKYKNQSSFYINWGNSLKILNVVLGVGSMCIASSSLSETIKNPIYIVLSGLYSISSSVYGIFSFSEKGVVLKDISYQLDNLSRMIRCEILKPPHNRQSVNDFIIFIQSARDKIIKKDNTN